jgi:hypothetical protein
MSEVSLPPFRHYTDQIVRVGNELAVLVVMRCSDRLNVERLMKEGNVITQEEVSEWNKMLPFQLPPKDLADLTDELNLIRVTVPHDEAIADLSHLEAAHRRVEKSITQLTQDLPTLIEFLTTRTGQRSATSATVFDDLLASATNVRSYLTFTRGLWGDRLAKARGGHNALWHGDAVYLMFLLELAAKRAGQVLSFTKPTTPAVRFIDAALDRAGVEHGSVEAISRELARYKAKAKDLARQHYG